MNVCIPCDACVGTFASPRGSLNGLRAEAGTRVTAVASGEGRRGHRRKSGPPSSECGLLQRNAGGLLGGPWLRDDHGWQDGAKCIALPRSLGFLIKAKNVEIWAVWPHYSTIQTRSAPGGGRENSRHPKPILNPLALASSSSRPAPPVGFLRVRGRGLHGRLVACAQMMEARSQKDPDEQARERCIASLSSLKARRRYLPFVLSFHCVFAHKAGSRRLTTSLFCIT